MTPGNDSNVARRNRVTPEADSNVARRNAVLTSV